MDTFINTPQASQQPQNITKQSETTVTTSLTSTMNTEPTQKKSSSHKKAAIGIVMTILLLIVSIVIIAEMTISPLLKTVDLCFRTEAAQIGELNKALDQISSGKEKIKLFCETDTASFRRLTSCIDASRTRYPVGSLVLTLWPKFNKILNETITSHNAACPASPINYP